jgi:DNA-binding MarR family transcriptional regulator
MASLKSEIEQTQPFASLEEEVFLNLIRSSDFLHRAAQRRIRGWGVTLTQYNVLRILGGAEPNGLTCASIGRRMIAADPDITRLLNRLKGLKLIHQRRDRHDRRVVWTQISDSGLELLRVMDPVVQRTPRELLSHMSSDKLTQFNHLLELARATAVSKQESMADEKNAVSQNCNELESSAQTKNAEV